MLLGKVIFAMLGGSHAYNLARPSSDKDIFAVYSATPDSFWVILFYLFKYLILLYIIIIIYLFFLFFCSNIILFIKRDYDCHQIT